MFIQTTFCVVFAICGWYFIQYLKARLDQHNITNEMLYDLIKVLANKEDNEMRDEDLQ